MLVTFILLTLAVLALWIPSSPKYPALRHAWLMLFLAAIAAGLVTHIVAPLGIVWLALFALVLTGTHLESPRWLAPVSIVALLLLAAALMAHLLPGFNNPRVISYAQFTPDALPFRLHFNFDKTAVGLLLLAFLHARIVRLEEWRALLVVAAPAILATVVTLLGLSLAFGYVRFAPKFPSEAPYFLWANLCFTCVAEEALFRGFIQHRLTRRWAKLRHGPWLALGIAAVLFGLAHFAGGPTYILLSTIAGVGYGWAYLRCGQCIEASILTHFIVNATHFLFFTYPALAPK
ncbi:MAG: CPBP family intramembrane glutamic endopeptidase [Verrucomicrobiota bacterium]